MQTPLKTLLACLCLFIPIFGYAQNNAKQEITQLIEAVEQSDCSFVRNGKTYTAQQGADHLRLKLKKGGKYADTTEHFITRLASKSSWSGKPYHIKTKDGTSMPMEDWLNAQLKQIRTAPPSEAL